MSVCVADVNNDGNQDILIGAPLQSVVNYDEGTVSVYYGTGDVCMSINPTHDYIKMEITVLYLKFHGSNCRFIGRKYPFTGSAYASSVNSICDHQISN